MELADAALRRSALLSAASVDARGSERRRAPGRVACVGGFAEEGHIKYYDAAPARRWKAVEAVARDLSKLCTLGLVAGDAAKEKDLSIAVLLGKQQSTDLLLQELNQMDEECKTKEV